MMDSLHNGPAKDEPRVWVIKTSSFMAILSHTPALIAKVAQRSWVHGDPAEAENKSPQRCRSSSRHAALGRWENLDA